MEDEQKPINIIEEAKLINDEIKKNITEYKELIARAEQAKAEQILSGKSEAGIVIPAIDPEIERKSKINEMLKSTGMHI